MLTELTIKNFALIEEVHIPFSSGLNVITGETGAGKSILLAALTFLFGEKGDVSLIRQGSESATVEALFSSYPNDILEAQGIECEEEELIIKRTIFSNGKTKAFVNNQAVTVSLLKTLYTHLIELSSQHAYLQLIDPQFQLNTVDRFGKLQEELTLFQQLLQEQKKFEQEFETIVQQEKEQLVRTQFLSQTISELGCAKLLAEEEEELTSEYNCLCHQDELAEGLSSLSDQFSEGTRALLPQMKVMKNKLAQLAAIDPKLSEEAVTIASAQELLLQVSFNLERYASKVEHDPKRLEYVNQRIAALEQLKKKYSKTIPELIEYYKQCVQEQQQFNDLDERKEVVARELCEKKAQVDMQAMQLTQMRKEAAVYFSRKVEQEIQSLNMANARFEVELEPIQRSFSGDERACFYLTPNKGEKRVTLDAGASGGEIARVAIGIKSALVQRQSLPELTLIFDEIDATIGGETASKVAEKLTNLGVDNQIIAISHFPQIAARAAHHLSIRKEESQGRTYSHVKLLQDVHEKHEELARMLGNNEQLIKLNS